MQEILPLIRTCEQENSLMAVWLWFCKAFHRITMTSNRSANWQHSCKILIYMVVGKKQQYEWVGKMKSNIENKGVLNA